MTPRRLILDIKYGETILFDEKDTAQAYAILSRAQIVSSAGYRGDVMPTNGAIGISLIPASKVKPAKVEPPEEDVIPPIPAPTPYPPNPSPTPAAFETF